jgi:hypothetical protein
VTQPAPAVQFREIDPARRVLKGGGRPFEHIPQQIQDWLTESYRTGLFAEIPIARLVKYPPAEVVRRARIHCRRHGKSLQFEIDTEAQILRLRMRDKRPYVKKADQPRWQQ